ncbi:MAG TPA: hypothetical protein VK212_08800 [Lentimicrobium sp.]|nr:hypothetical protein [Lentimicrobium sp.]
MKLLIKTVNTQTPEPVPGQPQRNPTTFPQEAPHPVSPIPEAPNPNPGIPETPTPSTPVPGIEPDIPPEPETPVPPPQG